MSLFKLIEVRKTAEKETQSIYDKDSLNEAIIAMHNDFGAAVKQDENVGVYCIVINNNTGAREDFAQWGEGVKERVYTHNDYADDNIAAYDNNKLAIGNFHTKLASQRSHEGCKFAITLRIGTMANIAESDVWVVSEEAEPQEQGE